MSRTPPIFSGGFSCACTAPDVSERTDANANNGANAPDNIRVIKITSLADAVIAAALIIDWPDHAAALAKQQGQRPVLLRSRRAAVFHSVEWRKYGMIVRRRIR
ncbi:MULTISPECIES: hypothetical protein [unclassified Bradyrhizobium]|uniref:hypothetical protein n=1 Tax=unclassified Bradyrhizobium TaxID=2631580 RepID=UPI0028E5E8F8|nr:MULTISPECIES: hypothetical protein [unclassified Bradyrhizobium]